MTEYNANAPKANPEKKSKEFTSPTNDGDGSYGRTKNVKFPATPRDPLAEFEGRSKAESDNHENG